MGLRATWHPVPGEDGATAVRVTLTWWGWRDAYDQRGVTVPTLRHAWRVVTAEGAVHPDKAADRIAFRTWAALGRS